MARQPRDLDYVRLLRAVDGWPAGTEAVVIAEEPESALLEVLTEDQVDEEGLPLRDLFEDLVSVDYEDLEVVDAVSDRAR
jgi:hypothetical protein